MATFHVIAHKVEVIAVLTVMKKDICRANAHSHRSKEAVVEDEVVEDVDVAETVVVLEDAEILEDAEEGEHRVVAEVV